MLIGKETATRKRYSAPTRDPDTGRSIDGAPTSSMVTGSFQPLKGREREALPEGVRQSETIKLYTRDDLRTADQHAGTPADEIEYDGREFVVIMVSKYAYLIPHYKVILQRKQERE